MWPFNKIDFFFPPAFDSNSNAHNTSILLNTVMFKRYSIASPLPQYPVICTLYNKNILRYIFTTYLVFLAHFLLQTHKWMSWWMLGILMKSIFQKWKGSDKVGNTKGTGYTKFGFRVPTTHSSSICWWNGLNINFFFLK